MIMSGESQVGSIDRVVGEKALDIVFRNARTHNVWHSKAVPQEVLRQVYELAKWGPTSANCSPMRIVFLTTADAKERLLPAMAPLNVEKTRNAPVTAIMAYDLEFYEKLPRL